VGTVPEGLLVTLTVSLSLSARNMYAKNVLVKVCGCGWLVVVVGRVGCCVGVSWKGRA
jgi:magnesium-transporting ATPase (P-type)